MLYHLNFRFNLTAFALYYYIIISLFHYFFIIYFGLTNVSNIQYCIGEAMSLLSDLFPDNKTLQMLTSSTGNSRHIYAASITQEAAK